MKQSDSCGILARGTARLLASVLSATLLGQRSASATEVGQSALLGTLDYSDTFTLGTARRVGDFHYTNPDSADTYYNIESGTSSAQWHPTQNFSFNVAANTVGDYPGNTGNLGAVTGLAQTGGGDFDILYGQRDHYVVQVDATYKNTDRIDIGSYPTSGSTLFAANSLTVFFRNTGAISLYNGATETDTGFVSGIADTAWHNYAVAFNRTGSTLAVYVDETLKGSLDLTTFAGGIYAAYANVSVGVGAGGYVAWFDNFQVGAPASDATVLVDTHRTETFTGNSEIKIGTLIDTGRLVKQGQGALTVTNAYLSNGAVEIEAGTFETGTDVGGLPSALRSGLAFWVDANHNVDVSGNEVTTWYDAREATGGSTYPRACRYGSDPGPLLAQGGADVAGRSLVDFGTYGCGRWLMWQDALGNLFSITNIRTVFIVASCVNGYGFLLGDWDSTNDVANSGRSDFHVGGAAGGGNPEGQALMDASWWTPYGSGLVIHGQTFINGVFVRGEEQIVATRGEVMSLATIGDTWASNFGNDRNMRIPDVSISRQGGGRIGEALIYTSVLTESQRRMVESYLMKKWLGHGVGTVRVAQGAELRFRANETNDLSAAHVSGLGTVSVMDGGQLIVSALADQTLPPIRLGTGACVDSGTAVQRMDQPYMLEGGSAYAASNGVWSRSILADATLIEKTGADTLTASEIASDVQRITVKAGTLRLAPPLPGGPACLSNALDNASFETFSSVGTEGNAYWGYQPVETGWTIRSDMTSPNGAEWSAAGLANPSKGVPWCATQPAPDGNWVIFLKRAGELEHTFEIPAPGRYEVAFFTAARPNYAHHLYQVFVDATNIIGSVRTAKTTFSRITCVTPPLAAGTHTLCFKGIYGSEDRASLIDAVTFTPVIDADYVAVPNSGFESPSELATTVTPNYPTYFEYSPTNAGWTFVADPAVTNSGITEGNGPWYYAHLSEGGHAAFLRQTGQFSTAITFPSTGTYRLTFRAAGRAGFWGDQFRWYNGHDFDVTLGGQQVAHIITYSSDFATYTYTLPPIGTEDPLTQTLAFVGINQGDPSTVDRASLIDDVRIDRIPSLANPSFETSAVMTNVLGNDTWQAGITNAGWAFCAGADQRDQSGIARSGSDWGNTVPEGTCNAFLQMRATIRQAVAFNEAGTYTLSFLAAARQNFSDHDFRVIFGGVPIGYVRTSAAVFQRYFFRLPRVKANTSYVLSFEGVNHGDDTDRASFIDSVLLAKTDDPFFDVAAIPKLDVSLDEGASLDLDYTGVIQMERVAYNGHSRTGLLNADNTAFIHGTGSLYAPPKGTVLYVW